MMNNMNVTHKGWEWDKIDPEKWNEISSEFLPVAIDWAGKFRSMIDIGAGKGRHALYMNRLGLAVQAVDLAESSIQIIKEKNAAQNGTVGAQLCDMTALPFADGSFDCAICFHAIYHTDLEGLKKAVAEIRRVLRSGGEAYITFNSKDNSSFQTGESIDNYTICKTEGVEAGIPHTYIDFDDLSWLMEGFALVKVQQIRNFIYQEHPTGGNHFYVLARKL